MPYLSTKDIAKAVYLAAKNKTAPEQSQIFGRTAVFLARKGMLSRTGQILAELRKIINEAEGKISVAVHARNKLSEEEKRWLTEELHRRYAGKKIELEEKTDPDLIGGYKIEAGDEQIDLTLKNRLSQLQVFLTK